MIYEFYAEIKMKPIDELSESITKTMRELGSLTEGQSIKIANEMLVASIVSKRELSFEERVKLGVSVIHSIESVGLSEKIKITRMEVKKGGD